MATRTRRRLTGVADLLKLVAVLLAIVGAVALFVLLGWGRPAYGFRDAPTVVVTVSPGTTCTTYYPDGAKGHSECPASWEVGGRYVYGTLTTEFGGELPGLTGEVQARVWGTTAATEPFRAFQYRWGLRSPYGLLAIPAAGLLRWLAASIGRRAAAQRLDEDDPERLGIGTERAPKVDTSLSPEVRSALSEAGIGEPVAVFRDKPIIVLPATIGSALTAAIVVVDSTGWRVVLSLVLLWVLLVLLGQLFLGRRPDRRISVLAQDGFYLRDPAVGTRASRYDQLAGMTRYVVKVKDRAPESRVMVQPADGDAFELGTRWAGWPHVGDRMVRDANAAVLPGLVERFDRGEALEFGVLGASTAGLRIGPDVVSWSMVDDLAAEGDDVVLRLGGERVTIPMDQISYLPALIWLAQRQRGVTPSP